MNDTIHRLRLTRTFLFRPMPRPNGNVTDIQTRHVHESEWNARLAKGAADFRPLAFTRSLPRRVLSALVWATPLRHVASRVHTVRWRDHKLALEPLLDPIATWGVTHHYRRSTTTFASVTD